MVCMIVIIKLWNIVRKLEATRLISLSLSSKQVPSPGSKKMDSMEYSSLEEIPLSVIFREQHPTSHAGPSNKSVTMPYATRSQASRASCRKNLDLMQAPYAAPKRCRKPNCKKHGSASISQSTLISLNSMRSSVITKEAKAEMALVPKKPSTDGTKNTPKMMAPTAMPSSTNYVGAISDQNSEDSIEWLEGFINAELSSIEIKSELKSELEPEELLGPLDFEETFTSFADLLSNEQKPSFAASKTEEALSNCSCSQQQLKMIQDLRNDFTVFAGQQTERIEMLTKLLLGAMGKDGRENNHPVLQTRNENPTVLRYPTSYRRQL